MSSISDMFRIEGDRIILDADRFQERLNMEVWGVADPDVFLAHLSPEERRQFDEKAKKVLESVKAALLAEMAEIGPNQFRCVGCRRVYDKGWSDEEAMNEAVANFGPALAESSVDLMCDDCYNRIHPHKHPDKVAAAVLEHMVNTQKP